jgi:ATP-dependent DNA helicase RecG
MSLRGTCVPRWRKSPLGERALQEAIARGFVTENDDGKSQKQPKLSVHEEKQPQKQPNLSISDFPTMLTWNVYHAIKLNRKAKYSWLADNLGVSERTIQRAIDDLKELGYINKEHSKITGEWQLLK